MDKIILNMIVIIFPIMMYLVFSCYNVLTNRRVERLVFMITILTSIYMSFYFNIDCNGLLILCNIPVLICYFKKEGLFGLVVSIIILLVSYFRYDANIYVAILKYVSYFITYILLYRRKWDSQNNSFSIDSTPIDITNLMNYEGTNAIITQQLDVDDANTWKIGNLVLII